MAERAKRDGYPIVAIDDHTRPKGINDAWWVTTESYCKRNSDESPYLIPNEWICGRIAQFLCIPIAPFSILKPFRRSPMFASLGMTSARAEPADARSFECMAAFPHLCAGVLLFDILVANCDRHPGNIKVDNPATPKWMRIIDHERALLGFHAKDGVNRLNEMWDRLGVTAGPVSGGNRHIFLDATHNSEIIWEWVNKISQLPDWYIRETCEFVVGSGINKNECKHTIDFLRYRRDKIETLVADHKAEFSGVKKWGLLFT